MKIETGDLVHVIADNTDLGLGLIVGSENDREGTAYRVLTSDSRCLYYFPWELHPIFAQEIQAEWVGP
jgi:hypothetical protein